MPILESLAAGEVTNPGPVGWRLHDPVNPALNTNLKVEAFSLRPREFVGTFDSIGTREDPVHVTEGRKGWQISLTARTDSQSEYERLDAILKTGRVLLLQDGVFPRQWYVKLTESGDWEQIRAEDPTKTYRVRWLYRMDLTFITASVPA